jgi:hypothetical protein
MFYNYVECRILFIVMLNVIILSIIMPNVVVLSVVAPNKHLINTIRLKAHLHVQFYIAFLKSCLWPCFHTPMCFERHGGQCYKNYSPNLRMFLISLSVVPGKLCQYSLMFMSKDRSRPKNGSLERCYTNVRSKLTAQIILGWKSLLVTNTLAD